MNALIQIQPNTLDGAAVQTVNARELHGFLESRADFSTWIKQQIERARLAEGRDYLVHKIVERQNQGLTGQGRIDYHLTLEAAKHIGMMSGTDKGFEVRDYFIECERRAQHKDPASLTRAEILRLALDSEEKRIAAEANVLTLQTTVAEQTPKVEFVDRYVSASSGSLGIRQVAKLLRANEREFIAFLIGNGILYRLGKYLTPYAQHIDAGRFEVKVGEGDNGHAFQQTLFTTKGIQWIAGEWGQHLVFLQSVEGYAA